MKHLVFLTVFSLVPIVACAPTGPRPPTFGLNLPSYIPTAVENCESMYPSVESGVDLGTGYFMFEGVDAEKARQCLVEKHGWYELGPPDWREGTMAPPRSRPSGS